MSVTINQKPRSNAARLLRILMWVALGHVIIILIMSPGLYAPNRNTPEALYERGEQALKDGKHAEAMELFRRVMDQQPKPPPIYGKAAEQHRLAEKLGKEATFREKAKQEQAATIKPAEAGPATQPMTATVKTTQPAKPFIPPELMPR